MIPKIIHYCWFGRNPLPPLAIKCIESWKKYLPDYEIQEWNEDNFDVNIIPYTQEAYQAKKFAFVSDYARLWILYNYGGIYFDTDVELIKPIYDIIQRGPFWGSEGSIFNINIISVAPGLGIGSYAKHDVYKQFLDYYSTAHLINNKNNKLGYITIVDIATNILSSLGWEKKNKLQKINDMYIYPIDFFAPIDMITNKLIVTSNTRSIHWYSGSWVDKKHKKSLKNYIRKIIPPFLLIQYNKFKNKKK